MNRRQFLGTLGKAALAVQLVTVPVTLYDLEMRGIRPKRHWRQDHNRCVYHVPVDEFVVMGAKSA